MGIGYKQQVVIPLFQIGFDMLFILANEHIFA